MIEEVEPQTTDVSQQASGSVPAEVTTTRSASSWRAHAWWISLTVHAVFIALLALWYLPANNTEVASAPTTTIHEQTDEWISASPSADQYADREPVVPAVVPPTHSMAAEIPDEQIRSSIESQLTSSLNRSDSQKLNDLEQNLDRLQRAVQPESMDELVQSVGRSMGLDTQMYASKSPKAGTRFNPDTAQLTGVTRTAKEAGGWNYVAEMVDANGNRENVPMTAAEGETAYQAFEQIKSMPMAAALYQQLVMPMLQQVVAPEKPRPAGNVVVPTATEEAAQATAPNAAPAEVDVTEPIDEDHEPAVNDSGK